MSKTMAQHAPGPWMMRSWHGGVHVMTDNAAPTQGVIAIMDHASFRQNVAVHEANARLIAAAPTLLEALEGVLGALDANISSNPLYGSRVVDAARAAIRAAREEG